ncbi:tautomerase family protein [Nocardia abscessus]|uniref:tautomerase family protein n=1 Tax=Nocardia abscessus TaxID=120957 RepID=UPI001E42F270|nr:N-acetylmuramic acid 6-phosphate etherase [Nocardia abscessus]
MAAITEAVDEVFHIDDVRVWLREYPAENVALDGRINAEPLKPLCVLEVPELHDMGARRMLAEKLHAAIHAAYQGLANTDETLILMNHYPLEHTGWAGRLQSDIPEMVEAAANLGRGGDLGADRHHDAHPA